ncbi:MAG: phenylalanine--tRNA ligase subunit beta, partial [Ruminiclostridium sp.]|nr:phenylalanine--tRNA ligase subunit beta [Ruminiclostridium sp.]
ELVELLGAGEVLDGVIDILNYVPQPKTLKLRPEKINALLGTDIDTPEMCRILTDLGFGVDGDDITVPSWRGDVEHYSDLAEEVARFFGYNRIPTTAMRGMTTQGGYSKEQLLERSLGSVCRSMGYDEIITYSFISPTYYDKIRLPEDDPLRKSMRICNPLGEDTSIMRTTVLPSMLEILTRNYNYRNKSAALYELGRTYFEQEDGLADEPKVLSLGLYGPDESFFTLKGAVETILGSIRAEKVTFVTERENPSYHPGRCAKVYVNGQEIGVLGQIHPLVAANYGVDTELFCAELKFDALFAARGEDPVYAPLPKFPAVTRDIAVLVDTDITVGTLEACILSAAKGLLKDVKLFDIYNGANLPAGKKSVAFNLILRADDRSLTAQEADDEVAAILKALEKDIGATLR